MADVLERIVCGIDGSPESLEALRQIELLRPRDAELRLLAVAELSLAVHGGLFAPMLYEQTLSAAEIALARAGEHSRTSSSRLVEGSPAQALLLEIDRYRATAVALGSHGQSRAAGILLGGTATTLLHEAPCSVLLAREPESPNEFPASIVVGVDGSSASLRALDSARVLGERLRRPLRVLAATGGKPLHLDGLRDVGAVDWDERKPADALVAASHGNDLVVVGSRGLHGLEALGSVSERVAHRSASSVLVVRAA